MVLERLGGFDQSLKALTELTQQIAARPCSHTPYFNDDITAVSSSPAVISTPHEHPLEAVELDGGGELSYGYPAPLVLIRSLLKRVEDAVIHPGTDDNEQTQVADAVRGPNIQATLRHKLDQFPCTGPCPQSVVTTDHRPIATPPRLLVDTCVDGYLGNINTSIPIFDDATLRQAIEAHYEGNQAESYGAWAIILNNIVLLELGLQTQLAHASKIGSVSIFDDLIPKFMRNCDRAMANLDAYNSPCLVNIQALLTLVHNPFNHQTIMS